MKKLYVAYGSNLNITQMSYRCPTAKPYSIGFLKDWKLVFKGSKTGSYASIIKSKGSSVPVLVWEIRKDDELRLDIYEGYPTFYYKEDISVETPLGEVIAMVYIMNDKALPGRPNYRYIDTIYEGYVDNDLDVSFLEEALEYNSQECS